MNDWVWLSQSKAMLTSNCIVCSPNSSTPPPGLARLALSVLCCTYSFIARLSSSPIWDATTSTSTTFSLIWVTEQVLTGTWFSHQLPSFVSSFTHPPTPSYAWKQCPQFNNHGELRSVRTIVWRLPVGRRPIFHLSATTSTNMGDTSLPVHMLPELSPLDQLNGRFCSVPCMLTCTAA